jgi:TetR/AcrR family transcriptional regulator, lmrAB and yxaGH operons repressor
MSSQTRTRMIDATVHALQHHGVAGMSFTEILAASGAARGAIYHHFPGGKSQLVAEAAALNGRDVRSRLAALAAGSPAAVIEGFLDLVRPVVEASASGGGCAVAAVTVGAEQDAGTLREIAAGAFASWTSQLAERLIAAGLEHGRAADLAATLIALLEGAHILCRAAGDIAPFDQISRVARSLGNGDDRPA